MGEKASVGGASPTHENVVVCVRLLISFIATVLRAFGVTEWQREVKQSVSDVLADAGVNDEITQPSCHFVRSQ